MKQFSNMGQSEPFVATALIFFFSFFFREHHMFHDEREKESGGGASRKKAKPEIRCQGRRGGSPISME
jgi:hypothetical protein